MQNEQSLKSRIASIDVLRGIVMVIMALDHTRDFFHHAANTANPLDPATTTPVLFFTRWVTHFCAPTFVFLSGLSIYLQSLRKSPAALSIFLLKRGLWLIAAEIIIVTFGITFNPLYNLLILQVIWAIGISMVLMAVLTRLPWKLVLAAGILIVCTHNLLDRLEAAPGFKAGFWWDLFHSGRFALYPVFNGHFIAIMYPFVPWLGLMLLGFCTGRIFSPAYTASKRKRMLQFLGATAILLFIILRLANVYGDPVPWSNQATTWRTVLSFINVFKYPPSLLYMCITIGPALLLLSFLEQVNNSFTRIMSVYGRTAFFYYLIHFYWLHVLVTICFFAKGHSFAEAVAGMQNIPFLFVLQGDGFSLAIVYLIWLFVVLSLYPLCLHYDRYKTLHKEKWWLSYL